MKRKNKKKYFAYHTKQRMLERFDLFITKHDIDLMGLMCKNNNYICHLGKQSLTRSKMILKYKDKIIPVIYDKGRHCIITVLTLEMLSKKEKEYLNNHISIKF